MDDNNTIVGVAAHSRDPHPMRGVWRFADTRGGFIQSGRTSPSNMVGIILFSDVGNGAIGRAMVSSVVLLGFFIRRPELNRGDSSVVCC